MSTDTRELLVYGAGGFGREVASMAELGCHGGLGTPPWRIIGFVDDIPGRAGETVHGIPCLGSLEQVVAARAGQESWCHIAIGNNEARLHAAQRIAAAGWKAATVVNNQAYVSWEVELGEGSFIAPFDTISPSVSLGRFTLINTRASIGHHVVLEDFSQISLNASVLGHGRVGRGAMIGAHAVVMGGVTVGAWATVGIGTPALTSVKPGHTICLPLAKTLFKRKDLPDESDT